eukprot:CAMPEP_0206317664 /NCGR_PEP_ID=MMETSP0106_2-20121207/16754_1 /ASSEMBLY_ACC=CAM_ASM_000206 /TAXON_ID=81532 /ORGANISM="Acanthoeca-like sp., Strain 10tr" /LENGTH=93 /DNA_ID=CAMNT_0053749267 /DNA_START=599 /DNA_END=880 /DNA_ORIENTATION=-
MMKLDMVTFICAIVSVTASTPSVMVATEFGPASFSMPLIGKYFVSEPMSSVEISRSGWSSIHGNDGLAGLYWLCCHACAEYPPEMPEALFAAT